jgi:hypothetical protein
MAEPVERSPPPIHANSDDHHPASSAEAAAAGHRPQKGQYPLWFGGLAATLASSIIFPLEQAKIRLQTLPGTMNAAAGTSVTQSQSSTMSSLGGSSGAGGAATLGNGSGGQIVQKRLRLTDVFLTELRTSGPCKLSLAHKCLR